MIRIGQESQCLPYAGIFSNNIESIILTWLKHSKLYTTSKYLFWAIRPECIHHIFGCNTKTLEHNYNSSRWLELKEFATILLGKDSAAWCKPNIFCIMLESQWNCNFAGHQRICQICQIQDWWHMAGQLKLCCLNAL